MKKNYNPYTVPDNFFEDTCKLEITSFRKRRRTLMCSAAAVLAAGLIIATPSFIHKLTDAETDTEYVSGNSLADMYEYDIFLQVNF